MRASLDSEPDPAKAFVARTRALPADLREADRVVGCLFTAMAIETAERSPQVRLAATEAIDNWQHVVARKRRAGGLSAAHCESASTLICALEGGMLASQMARDGRPLRLTGKHLARLVATYR